MGGIVFTNSPKAPPAPPPRAHRPRPEPSPVSAASTSCNSEMVTSTFAELPAACCIDKDDCATGFPSTCSQECGELVLPFWDSCESYMDHIPGYDVMDGMWHDFVSECRSGSPVTNFRCEYTELLPSHCNAAPPRWVPKISAAQT